MLRKNLVCLGLAISLVLTSFWQGFTVGMVAKAENTDEKVFLSSVEPTAKVSNLYLKDVDENNQHFSLLNNGEEMTSESGLLVKPNNNSYTSIYFTEIQEYGYKSFETYIGLDKSVRNTDGKVEFKFYADGKEVSNYVMDASMEAQYVKIDLQNVQVLRLVVDALGSNTNDRAVYLNANFTRNTKAPYLAVDDLEFNLSEQVTKENILEYVSAKDVNNNDLTNKITYSTNYKGEQKGSFKVTYHVEDDFGHSHERTVNMVVTGEDYTQNLSIDRLKKPWASYLYHGRGTLSTQGKKAWDIVLKEVLNFDVSKWPLIDRWNEKVYKIDINLQANGIYAKKSEVSYIGTMIMDDEPRTFIVKDWGSDVSEKDGLASYITVYISQACLRQDELLQKIEINTQNMLSEAKTDMTEAQKLYYVSNKYKSWLKYGNGGQLLSDSLGNGIAVCGGNARGYIYLSQRLGSKSVWGRSGSHAWSFTKLNDVKEWFKTDLLSGEFLAPGVNGEGNLSVGGNFRNRHYKWFTFGTVQYSKDMLRYPSVWVALDQEETVFSLEQSYNLYDSIVDFGSIFNQDFKKENIKITVDKVDQEGNVIKSNISSFPVEGNTNDLVAGYYRIHYTISDNGRTNYQSKLIRVTGEIAENYGVTNAVSSLHATNKDELGLWDGSQEKWYANAIEINNGGFVTFDIKDKNYGYITYDFGIKNAVRANQPWGQNGKVATRVTIFTENGPAEGEILYEGSVHSWYTKYETVLLKLPSDVVSIKVESLDKGNGNGHAGICNLTFMVDKGNVGVISEENPPILSQEEVIINDKDTVNWFELLSGNDQEDGEFKLNSDNFTIEELKKVNGKYVIGKHELSYTLKDKDGNLTEGKLIVYVKESPKTVFTITFVNDGHKTVIEAEEGSCIKALEVIKEKYEFLGWYNGDVLFDFNTPITSNLTLVAQWKLIEEDIPENDSDNDNELEDGNDSDNDNELEDGNDSDNDNESGNNNGVVNGNGTSNNNGVGNGNGTSNNNGVGNGNGTSNNNGVGNGNGTLNNNGVGNGNGTSTNNGVGHGSGTNNGLGNGNRPGNSVVTLEETKINQVKDEIKASTTGQVVTVEMENATVVPYQLLETAKGKDVTIVLEMGNYSWIISGKDINGLDLKDINLEVTFGTNNIPNNLINSLNNGNVLQQISLTHNGEFGFEANLVHNVGKNYAGKYANLYYYNPEGKMEFMNAGLVDEEGNVKLHFNHASDYALVIDTKDMGIINSNDQSQEDQVLSQTGDTTSMAMYIGLGALVLLAIVFVSRRKQN